VLQILVDEEELKLYFFYLGDFYEDNPHGGRRLKRLQHSFSPKPRDIKDNITFIEEVSDYPE
jgi:hypothetical protein